MINSLKTISSFGLCLLSTSMLAVAGPPPFTVDDPAPLDPHCWEFGFASQHIQTAAGWSGTTASLEINYGLVPDLQLHLLAPFAYDAPSGGDSHHGHGDTELGVKFRFLDESDSLPEAAIYPLVQIPTGDEQDGLGGSHTQAFLPIWLQKNIGAWAIYGGAGLGIHLGADNSNWEFGGLVIQRQITRTFLLGAEIYRHTAMTRDGGSNTVFNIGTANDFSDSHHLLITAGRSLDGPTDFQFNVTYQLTCCGLSGLLNHP